MGEEKKEFVAYLNDNGEKKEAWVEQLKITDSYVQFVYNSEKLTIPMSRLLKCKEKL